MPKRALIQTIPKTQNSLLWEMACEAGSVYSAVLEKQLLPKRQFLHSQSFQGSGQQAVTMIKAFTAASKAYKKNPSKFTGQPRFPKSKKLSVIIFKKAAIRINGRFLLLSTAQKDNPIKIRWSYEKPIYATISLKNGEWQLTTVYECQTETKKLGTKTMAIDLGVKRLAATFDGKNSVLFSGKPLLSLNRLTNKLYGQLFKLKGNNSRRAKNKKRAIRKCLRKAQNTKKDVLHKYSRKVVNLAVKQKCGTIVFGDCSTVHSAPNLGVKNNQKISQSPEQHFRKLIEYKFQDIGGKTEVIPETYTSQTCPACGLRHKPKGRVYQCSCGYQNDRDTVGAINIHVSFVNKRSSLLTRPLGWKYHPSLSCSNCKKQREQKEPAVFRR